MSREQIDRTFAPTRWGEVLVAATRQGVCALFFADDRVAVTARLEKMFPGAIFTERTTPVLRKALRVFDGEDVAGVPLDLRGTDFQREVWDVLLQIPRGGTMTYSEIAAKVGREKACRAVGSAVGANPVSVIVPCHRVLPRSGGVGQYAWGSDRKAALLDFEKTTETNYK